MRLTHFAFALTMLLLGVTGYLAWEGQQAKKGAYKELEFWKSQQQAREAAQPSESSMVPLPAAPAVSISPPAVAAAPVAPFRPSAAPDSPAPPMVDLPGTEAATTMAGTGGLPGGGLTVPKTVVAAEAKGISTNTLTAAQKNVLGAKPVAKVKTVVKEQGFVIINAGSAQGMAKGQKYEIRRDSAVLARVTVDTVEETEAVADLNLASIPAGVVIEPGDEVIEAVGPVLR